MLDKQLLKNKYFITSQTISIDCIKLYQLYDMITIIITTGYYSWYCYYFYKSLCVDNVVHLKLAQQISDSQWFDRPSSCFHPPYRPSVQLS